MRNAIVTIYSQVVHQPSGSRRFWFGVSLLSPLRPILRNGNPFLKFLGNAFTGERILQRPTPRHLELELELIQTQMAQKPMPRAEVYAHAMRASQNRKKEVRREKKV